MKTGEEKFDDEIRQKLRHSEVTPPAGFFDHIVPPENKKRGFLWIWFAGILILVMTALMVRIGPQPQTPNNGTLNTSNAELNSKDDKEKSTTISGLTGSENKLPNGSHLINESNQEAKLNSSENDLLESTSTAKSAVPIDESQNENDYSGKHKKKNKFNPFITELRNNNSNAPVFNYDLLYVPAPSLPYQDSRSVKQQLKILNPSIVPFESYSPTPFGIEFLFSKLYGYSQTTEKTEDTLALRLLNSKGDLGDRPDGFDTRIRVTYALNNKFTLSAGIQYAELNQNFNFNFEEFYDELDIDTIQYYILFPFSPPMLVTEYDSTIHHLSRIHKIENKIKFKTVSLSAEIRYGILMGNFIIEPLAGIITDVYSTVDGTTNFNSRFEETDGNEYFENSIQARLKGGIQFSYTMSEKYNLFIQSEYQYALSSMKTAEPFYSAKTNQLTFGAGIRYNFFKKQAAQMTPGGSDIVNN